MKKLVVIILCLMTAFAATLFYTTEDHVYAENSGPYNSINNKIIDGEKGLFVTLSITINGGNGYVRTTATHDFSIFSSTVIVYLYLYCSDTYQESYTNMTLVASASTQDLDLNQSITAQCSTGGTQKYWLGRMCYKIDNGAWEERVTGAVLCDAYGNYISA